MPDNVTFQVSQTATPPNATVVATDEIGGAHYQLFKLNFGDNGTAYTLAYGTPMPIGTLPGGTFVVNGTPQVLGSVCIVGTLSGGSVGIVGTIQVLGTVQIHGTVQAIGTYQAHGTSQIIGTVQAHGTNQNLGTVQTHGTSHVLGSVNAQGVVAHGGAVAGNPVLFGGFGSSGTQAAVDDGDAVRPWYDLNGRAQITGTIGSITGVTVVTMPTVVVTATNLDIRDLSSASDSVAVTGTVQTHGTSQVIGTFQSHGTNQNLGTVQTHGTSQVIGTVQLHGTNQALGTFQPLAGSIHPAAFFFGSVQGWAAHDAAAGGAPVLMGGFGSSGTQAAVSDGDAVRAWFDLNGRLQVRGTIDSLPPVTATNLDIRDLTSVSDSVAAVQSGAWSVDVASLPNEGQQTMANSISVAVASNQSTLPIVGTVQAHGTAENLGTYQPLAGSVHVANTAAVLGTTSFVTGGTAHIGSVQRLTGGTLDFLGGTVAVGTVGRLAGTVLTRTNSAGEGFFGTRFTGAVTNGTLVPAPSAGTFVRVWGLIASGSAAGSAFFELGDGTIFGAIFTAANGGMVYNSAKGIRTNGTAQDVFFNCAAGTWGVSVEYTLETA